MQTSTTSAATNNHSNGANVAESTFAKMTNKNTARFLTYGGILAEVLVSVTALSSSVLGYDIVPMSTIMLVSSCGMLSIAAGETIKKAVKKIEKAKKEDSESKNDPTPTIDLGNSKQKSLSGTAIQFNNTTNIAGIQNNSHPTPIITDPSVNKLSKTFRDLETGSIGSTL